MSAEFITTIWRDNDATESSNVATNIGTNLGTNDAANNDANDLINNPNSTTNIGTNIGTSGNNVATDLRNTPTYQTEPQPWSNIHDKSKT